VLNVLGPGQVGIASSIISQATTAVFVLDYADDLWRFLAQHRVTKATGGLT
jgi:hypothetical protein